MRGTQSFLLQLEKNLEILPSTRDDALFPSGVSREISPSLLSLEKVLDTLEATQEVPDILVATRVEHRGSHHNSRKAPGFPLHLEMRVLFPALSGKESRCSRRTSRGGALHRKGKRNSRVVPRFPESPRYLSPFQGNLFSLHCLDFQTAERLTPRWHVGQPCGKASWESLEGKTQIP